MREPNPDKLNELVGKLVGDLGAAIAGAGVLLGDRLGIYKAMADGTPVTSSDLAKKTGLHERYLREWLSGQAASGYIDYQADKNTFSLSPEQAMAFAEEGSPAFIAGAFDIVQSTYLDEPKVADAFRTGKGVGWHEHSKCLFSGNERFSRPRYNANLVQNWIPALDGVEAKLKSGAKVADVGCGNGASTIVMAQAYPKSQFFGFDYYQPSLDRAANLAKEAGVDDHTTFEQASAKDFPARGYDLVADLNQISKLCFGLTPQDRRGIRRLLCRARLRRPATRLCRMSRAGAQRPSCSARMRREGFNQLLTTVD
jgi:hypothetical protein